MSQALDSIAATARELRQLAADVDEPVLRLELQAAADMLSGQRHRLAAAFLAAERVAIPAPAPPAIRPTIRYLDLVVNRETRRAVLAGRDINASRKEVAILSMLAEAPHRVFTKHEIIERVWGGGDVSTRTVDSHAARIRTKLGGAPWIHNVWGVGYSLRAADELPAARIAA